ncbi:MAG: hypothetical protein JOZ72_13225 [Alphaproteobacteria bacterium]|nr:hypothetical protein [Alphaproteobacteria bacterium]
MRAIEIVAGLILAAVLFVALKLLGLMLKVALIAAVLGFAIGIVLTRVFRSRGG